MAEGSGFALGPDAPRTFPEWIRHRARIGGDKVALEVCGVTRTYAELDDVTDRTAAGFAALGLAPGRARLADDAEQHREHRGLVRAAEGRHRRGPGPHGLARGGAPLHRRSRRRAARSSSTRSFLPHLAAIVDELPQLRQVIVNRNEPGEEAVELPSRLAVHDLAELYDTGAPVPTPRVERAQTPPSCSTRPARPGRRRASSSPTTRSST